MSPASTAGAAGLRPLPWNRPLIGDAEIAEVVDTLRSGWLTHGPKATRLEHAVRERLGVEDAFAVTSCTGALHLAFLAAGIGPGDEVITPSLTFCAAPNAILHTGARPVFADVDPVTLNITPETAEAAITSLTRAIAVMHYGGHMCDMRAFRELADRHGLLLIEDAAHALHASRDGLRAGSAGDLSTFSLYANKVAAAGEGGLLAGRGDLVQQARLLGRHGIDSSAWQRHGKRNTADYQVTVPGLKYVMSDLTAALAVVQYDRLAEFTERRAAIAAAYTQAFAGLPGLTTPTVLPGVEHGWFLYAALIDPGTAPLDRDQTAAALLARHQISTSIHFKPAHTLGPYQNLAHRPLPVTETAAARQLSLPCYPAMTAQDIDRVIEAVRGLWTRRENTRSSPARPPDVATTSPTAAG
ncbi:DegT/DnrJ/EryC1/StrS family aminotransferase [Streptomyces mobaraensis]|uniref:DegT/DnrJ/EryC1/StrS family aminotransferase n=1 Tax=Streptomyces mobaraensis TaxID=35621 RepID=A0A5N5W1K9_STRMB|nr:DegT/DnrJ/EryC1/StrS family aminotransferase [Streptomyces mobaraensis]KAB7835573.1 DegT/DnrJ/EryC1/StrS family aminotransferase [Streptomyces mobaraensis]